MIRYLAQPSTLLGILLAAVVGLYLHDAAQTLAASALGNPAALRSGRLSPGPRRHLDVYGSIAYLLAGYGYGQPVPVTAWRQAERRKAALALAAGPLTYLVLTLAFLAVYAGTAGSTPLGGGPFGDRVLAVAAAWSAALFVYSCIPVPPLDGGRILFLLAPRDLGWQRAEYQLVERNIGVLVALLIAAAPLLLNLAIVEQIADPLFRGLAGVFGLS